MVSSIRQQIYLIIISCCSLFIIVSNCELIYREEPAVLNTNLTALDSSHASGNPRECFESGSEKCTSAFFVKLSRHNIYTNTYPEHVCCASFELLNCTQKVYTDCGFKDTIDGNTTSYGNFSTRNECEMYRNTCPSGGSNNIGCGHLDAFVALICCWLVVVIIQQM